jgi:hypothetical protein
MRALIRKAFEFFVAERRTVGAACPSISLSGKPSHHLRGVTMSGIFISVISSGIVLMLSASLVNATGEPSAGAKGMPGAVGTFEFKPTDWIEGATTWWFDTDGVDPGKAGCHIGTDEKGKPNARMFGEACLPDGMLVETNPEALKLHSHKNDVGHPDKFDCNAWCVGKGSAKGACVVAAAPPCKESAMCECE